MAVNVCVREEYFYMIEKYLASKCVCMREEYFGRKCVSVRKEYLGSK